MGKLVAMIAPLACVLLTELPARADDAVMEWNQIALASTVMAGQGPRALIGLFPAQATMLNQARATSLASRGLTDTSPGVAFGEAVASMILAVRSNDGAAQAQFPYTAPGAGTPGVWVPVGTAPPVLPGWGKVTLWVVRNLSQFEPDGPPPCKPSREGLPDLSDP